MDNRPSVLVDFDGVIHSYKSGWQGSHLIPDDPVPGAVEWLETLSQHFKVIIFSTRANDIQGEAAIVNAIERWCIGLWGGIPDWVNFLTVTSEKKPAVVIIDDRAIRFNGDFNEVSPEVIKSFTPWNR